MIEGDKSIVAFNYREKALKPRARKSRGWELLDSNDGGFLINFFCLPRQVTRTVA